MYWCDGQIEESVQCIGVMVRQEKCSVYWCDGQIEERCSVYWCDGQRGDVFSVLL